VALVQEGKGLAIPLPGDGGQEGHIIRLLRGWMCESGHGMAFR
jgi:hypothetical protein